MTDDAGHPGPPTTGPAGAAPHHAFPPRLVRASAGSGKTYALVHRTIGLLAADVAPERILATTFTRKAAGEILGRILLRLAECALDAKARTEVNREIPTEFAVDAARARTLLARTCAALPRLQIETLDAFFHRIAAAHAYELGLPPDWRIGDPASIAAIRRRAIHDLLEAEPDRAVDLMRRLHRGDVGRSVTEQLDGLVVDLHHAYLESPESAWDTIAVPPAPSATDIAHARGALEGFPLPQTQKKQPVKHWVDARRGIIEAIDTEDTAALLGNGLVKKILAGDAKYSRHPIAPEWVEALEAPFAAVRARELAALREQNLASHELIAHFDAFENARRDALGIYDFRTMTVRLASESMLQRMRDGIDRIYERIDARIDHVLLDEFQDTSLFQFLVLEPILDELIADLGAQRTFYCVGDVKQAIYGWRGGRRALFDAVETMLPPGSAETRSHSWRSSPVVLDTVNRVFERIGGALADPDDAAVATEWQDSFPAHASMKKDLPGYVELRIATPEEDPPEDPGDDAAGNGDEEKLSPERKRALPYERTLETIRRIHARDPRRTIGVLLRTNKNVAPLIDLLREEGIDASQEGGNPLTDSPAVNRVLAALHFADHPGDRAARFAVSRCRLGASLGLPPDPTPETDGAIARGVRRACMRDGLGMTVRRLVHALAPSCEERDRPRLDQLVELAFAVDAQGGLRASDFVERVRRTPVESPTGSPVQVMTIHRSKGLEFDVVILPQLTDSWSTPTPTILTASSDPARPADRITRYVGKDLALLCDDELGPIRRGHRAELINEAINLLYVAMTRAKHALHLFLPPGKLGDGASYGRILRMTLGGDRAEETGDGDPVLFTSGDPDWLGSAEPAEDTAPGTVEIGAGETAPGETAPGETAPGETGKGEAAPDETAPAGTASDESDDAFAAEPVHSGARAAPSPSARGEGVLDATGGGTGLGERFAAMQLGTAVHALLEALEWVDGTDAILDDALDAARRIAPLASLPAAVLDHAERLVRTTLATSTGRDVFDRAATHARLEDLAGGTIDAVKVARELPYGRIAAEGKDPEVGVIDRIHVATRDGAVVAAEVLDAKTAGGVLDSAEGVEGLRAHLCAAYAPQLEAYRGAVAALLGLPPERITARVLALPSGLVVDVLDRS